MFLVQRWVKDFRLDILTTVLTNKVRQEDLLSACVLCCAVTCHVQLFLTIWTIACQASLSMEFSKKEYWNGLPFATLRDLPDLGIKSVALEAAALASRWILYH